MGEKSIVVQKKVVIGVDHKVQLDGLLAIPSPCKGLVLFAHGSGSSHKSARNQMVASFLQEVGVATLLFDLLSIEEEEEDMISRELRFNIPFLSSRLLAALDWATVLPELHEKRIGFFGASTGTAAALTAAAELGIQVSSVVSRGGRPDLAGNSLPRLRSPTLLIVGGADFGVIELNQRAFEMIGCEKKLEIIPNATHLFEESGALEEVGRMAARWFETHFSY